MFFDRWIHEYSIFIYNIALNIARFNLFHSAIKNAINSLNFKTIVVYLKKKKLIEIPLPFVKRIDLKKCSEIYNDGRYIYNDRRFIKRKLYCSYVVSICY